MVLNGCPFIPHIKGVGSITLYGGRSHLIFSQSFNLFCIIVKTIFLIFRHEFFFLIGSGGGGGRRKIFITDNLKKMKDFI